MVHICEYVKTRSVDKDEYEYKATTILNYITYYYYECCLIYLFGC